ncbi:MAG TPA: bifunctional DNA primase/polymerase [Acidimicrobiales bacterium]|nr:bifunctional DNA primase/polymerase [Acidimicrobiales bacterium]
MSAQHAAALRLARGGWPVLACHYPIESRCSCGDRSCPSPGKHPLSRHGLHDATIDPAVIESWWRGARYANPAVRTGARPAGAGVIVLDTDPVHGGATSLAGLVAAHGALPATLEVLTGGGGRHLYFAHAGPPVPNSAGRLGPGLDIRGDGGYVLVPPSVHAAGGRYRWVQRPLRALPDWLADLGRPSGPGPLQVTEGPARPVRQPGAWAAAALAAETQSVKTATEGTRNHTLNRAAFALGQLVAAGYLDTDDVAATLTDAALAAGLTTAETRATIASGLRAGIARPRHPAG